MGLAELLLHEKYDDDAILAAFPADHYIENVGEFSQSIEFAMRAAEETEGIVTIGIEPTRPETQYGYVQIKDEPGDLGELYDYGVRYTQTFAEKPDRGTALRFIESGDFLWNSGIFVLSLGAVRHAMEKYLPEHALQFRSIKKHIGRETFEENLDYIYRQMNSISFDYAIMEKAGNVFVVESSFQWSDLGTWDELYRLSMKDARNNVIEGDVISINTSNSFVSSQGKIIGVIGLDDVIVVDSDEALLICKRGDADSISDLLDYLKRKNINKYL
jgi:mannose-1-phosphate guanylyltransferase